MPIAQMRGLAARAARELRLLRRRRHGAARPFVPGRRRVPQLHDPQAGRRGGLIMPWNAPLMLSTWRIAPALAAGNTVVLKPAEWSPLLVDAARRPCSRRRSCRAASSTSCTASARPRARRSSAHPGVDLIASRARRRPASASSRPGAPTLKRSSVELGGKSPVVVFDDADAELVRRRGAGADLHDERAALHGRARACSCSGRSTSSIVDAIAERARDDPRRRPVRPATRSSAR